MIICLHCLEYSLDRSEIVDGRNCSNCGNRIVFGPEKDYYSLIDYRGSRGQLVKKLVRDASEIYRQIEKATSRAVEGAEDDVEESVADEIPVHFYFNYSEYPASERNKWGSEDQKIGILFTATCLSYFQNELGMDAGRKIFDREADYDEIEHNDFDMKFRQIATEAQYPVFSDFSSTVHGKYSSRDKEVEIRKIPPEYLEQIKNSLDRDRVPYLLEPFLDYITVRDDSLTSILNHEMTHAYIDEKTDFPDKPYLEAIEEASAQVTSYIRRGSWETGYPDCSIYRDERMPKALLQTLIRCFMEIADEHNGSKGEKISFIRKKAVNVIERMQDSGEKIHPINAVISGTDSELEHLYKLMKGIETAEYYAFHAMQLLGVIKRDQEMKDWAHDSAKQKSPYSFRSYENSDDRHFGPEREINEPLMSELVPEMKKAEQELEKIASNKENPREKQEINEIKQDLGDFLELFISEGNYFNNLEHREMTDFEEKLAVNSRNSKVGAIVYRKNLNDVERNAEKTINEYLDVIGHSKELNEKIIRLLENLHSEEGVLNRQLGEESPEMDALGKLAEETEQAYEIFMKTEKDLERSLTKLEKTLEQVD